MQQGRYHSVLQRQRRLDQPGDARRNIQMPDIGLGGPQRTEPARIGASRKSLMQGRKFDRVAKRCRRAMRLDIADVARSNPGRLVRRPDYFRLRFDRRRCIPRLSRAVIVDGIAPDHRDHSVAVRQRIFQPAQHHQSRAIAKHRARGIRIKRAAMPVSRRHCIGHVFVIAL